MLDDKSNYAVLEEIPEREHPSSDSCLQQSPIASTDKVDRMKRCAFCDKPPVVWYMYGHEEGGNIATCAKHERRIKCLLPFIHRIERLYDGILIYSESYGMNRLNRQLLEQIIINSCFPTVQKGEEISGYLS